MANALIDVAGSNIAQVAPPVVTAGQAWKIQILGTYNLVYPYAAKDFVHIADFQAWLKAFFDTHIHGNGNDGSPTTKPMLPTQILQALAAALLQPNAAVGTLRLGNPLDQVTTASLTASAIAQDAADLVP
jgi:hypothetical protein